MRTDRVEEDTLFLSSKEMTIVRDCNDDHIHFLWGASTPGRPYRRSLLDPPDFIFPKRGAYDFIHDRFPPFGTYKISDDSFIPGITQFQDKKETKPLRSLTTPHQHVSSLFFLMRLFLIKSKYS